MVAMRPKREAAEKRFLKPKWLQEASAVHAGRIGFGETGASFQLGDVMKSRRMWWSVSFVVVLGLATVAGVLAQNRTPEHFSGIFNDYTPATGISGPWEMHGTWELKLKDDGGKADFSAIMTMEHPDSWIAANPGTSAAPNVDNPAMRMPHTHHITMTNATVSSDTSVCQPDSPATIVRLVIIGQPPISGNGNPAPFETLGPSTLQVCITGQTLVEYSNLSMSFTPTSPAAIKHFGSQAIHGVVRKVGDGDRQDDDHR
jgi:hypothetical protein